MYNHHTYIYFQMRPFLKDLIIILTQWVILPAVIGFDNLLQKWFGIILVRCNRRSYMAGLTAEEAKELQLPSVKKAFRLLCEAGPYMETKANILGRHIFLP